MQVSLLLVLPEEIKEPAKVQFNPVQRGNVSLRLKTEIACAVPDSDLYCYRCLEIYWMFTCDKICQVLLHGRSRDEKGRRVWEQCGSVLEIDQIRSDAHLLCSMINQSRQELITWNVIKMSFSIVGVIFVPVELCQWQVHRGHDWGIGAVYIVLAEVGYASKGRPDHQIRPGRLRYLWYQIDTFTTSVWGLVGAVFNGCP